MKSEFELLRLPLFSKRARYFLQQVQKSASPDLVSGFCSSLKIEKIARTSAFFKKKGAFFDQEIDQWTGMVG